MATDDVRDLVREARAAFARDPSNPSLKAALERAERIEDFRRQQRQNGTRYLDGAFRSIETLATALLALPVTFRNRLATDPASPGLLRWAWIFRTVSIVTGVMHRFAWATAYLQ
jgi:hypothetical protein